jgi:hypothetical protein
METEKTIEKILVTPYLASKLLEKNIDNRRISQAVVNSYADEMSNGNWREDTFEFIKISKDGFLLDGQHRLLAVIKSQKSINFQLAYGLPKDIFPVLDTGSNRSSRDVFSIKKIDNANVITASIKSYIINKRGYGRTHDSNLRLRITNTIILEEYESRPEFWQEVATFGLKGYRNFAHVLSSTTIGSFYAHFNDFSPEQSRDFISQLCTGENVVNSTIITLRNLLIKDKISTKKISSDDKYNLIIKSWNAFRLGKNYRVLKYDKGTESKQKAI